MYYIRSSLPEAQYSEIQNAHALTAIYKAVPAGKVLAPKKDMGWSVFLAWLEHATLSLGPKRASIAPQEHNARKVGGSNSRAAWHDLTV